MMGNPSTARFWRFQLFLRYTLLFSCLTSSCLASAYPVIQEIYYDQPGSDGNLVFTEIFGAADLDLSGWSLSALNGNGGSEYRRVSLTGAVIPDDGILLVTTTSAVSWLRDLSDFSADIDWQNGPDALQLIDPAGTVIDSLQYGISADLAVAESAPAEDVSAGYSLSRILAGFDTDDNRADFTALANPTPGTADFPLQTPTVRSIPLPGTASLFLLALVPLLCSRSASYRRTEAKRES